MPTQWILLILPIFQIRKQRSREVEIIYLLLFLNNWLKDLPILRARRLDFLISAVSMSKCDFYWNIVIGICYYHHLQSVFFFFTIVREIIFWCRFSFHLLYSSLCHWTMVTKFISEHRGLRASPLFSWDPTLWCAEL